jgi:hypothetical protein
LISIGKVHRVADSIAAIDQELIQLSQETLYFFIVIFVLDLKLFDSPAVKYVLAITIMLLSALRFAYFLAVLLLARTVSLLPSEQKGILIDLYNARDVEGVVELIREQIGLRSARRVAIFICHEDKHRLFRIAKIQ